VGVDANNEAKTLKEHRARKGWSQAELAERSGVHVTTVSHYETGDISPSYRNLKKIADALEVRVDDIALPAASVA
jgi:transcriptional regulator with XRE-family HTH domain